MRVGRAIAILLLLVGPGLRALAEDALIALTVEAGADAVLKAVEARDAAALKALAERNDPDPWLVADALLSKGHGDVALAFAKAAPRKDTEALPAYLEHRGDTPGVDALQDLYLRGESQARQLLWTESETSFRASADGARAVGWWSLAARALQEAGRSAFRRSDYRVALALYQRRLSIEEARENPRGVAHALDNIGSMHNRLGDAVQARTLHERSLRLSEELGDRFGVARSCANLGILHSGRGELRKALTHSERSLALSEELGDRAGQAQVLVTLGGIHRRLGDHPTALSCQERALAAFEALGDRDGAATALANLGLLHEARSDYPQARAYQQRALAMFEALGNRMGVASTFGNLANLHLALGDRAAAVSYYERALVLLEAIGNRSGVALTLGNLGNVHLKLGAHAKARTCLERALSMAEALGDRASLARNLDHLGRLHFQIGEYPRALALYERSLALAEELGDQAQVAATLNSLGSAHFRRGDYTRARATYERSLALAEASGNRAAAARTLGNLGNVHFRRGDFDQALDTHERALAVMEALGDRVGVAKTLGNLGVAHDALGNFPSALACYKRVLAIAESLGDTSLVAVALGNLGAASFALGNYENALAHRERSLALFETLGRRADVANALGGLGLACAVLGDYPRAIQCLERALTERIELGDRLGWAATASNLASIHHSLGGHATALVWLRRTLEVWEEVGGRRGQARALGNIGTVLMSLGRNEEALVQCQRALAMKREIGDRLGIAITLGTLGLVHEALGDLAGALAYHEEAYAESEAIEDRAGMVFALTHVGFLQAKLGAFADACRTLERAVREARRLGAPDRYVRSLRYLAEVMLDGNEPARALLRARAALPELEPLLLGLGEEEGAAARETFSALFGVGALAAARLGDAGEVAEFLERGRATSLLETLRGGRALRAADLPSALVEADAGAKAKEARARWEYGRALDEGKRKVIRRAARAVDEAMEVRREVAARIQREAKRVAGVFYPRAATLEEIQGWMEPGMALVVYGLCLDETLALVVTPEAERIVSLGTVKDVEAACASLVCDEPTEDSGASVAALRTLLVESLALPDDVKTVLVSPDGALGYVPWGALFDRPVACVPSGTTWVLLREEEREPGEKILALGDPDYSARPDDHAVAIYTRGGRLTPLPATRDEAKVIGDVVLLGQEASGPALTEALQKEKRWRAVHLACHGLVDPERPMLSSLALTPTAEDDGFLTCLDIFRMQVPADLVTLSACETARGKVYRAEGIVGLTRAFMYAGAPRVLCSLWKVDDEATRALMTKFYELWNPKEGDGLPAAEALRQAQAYVAAQEKWEHPYYWAAWVLWGLAE